MSETAHDRPQGEAHPTNPEVAHEPSDVSVKGVLLFAAGLVVLAVVLLLTALYGVLFLIVRRADRILRRQYAQQLEAEADLQRAYDSLESRVE